MPLFNYHEFQQAKKLREAQRTKEEALEDTKILLRDMRARHTQCRFMDGVDMRCSWCRNADNVLSLKEVA